MAARFIPRPPTTTRPNPHLYEINTWQWLEELSVRLGREITLNEVPDSEWDALARLGFNIVWLVGVWRRSPESRRIIDSARHAFLLRRRTRRAQNSSFYRASTRAG